MRTPNSRRIEMANTNDYSLWNAAFDLFMTVITGGFWLIWVAVRYLRTH